MDESGIGRVSDFLNDTHLILSEVRFDELNREVDVSFEKKLTGYATNEGGFILEKFKAPVYRFHLLIRNSAKLTIHDTEEIEIYGIETIEFDHERSTLTIVTDVPLGFSVMVEDIDLTIIREAELVGYENYRSLFGP